jgi:hypothetical protein
MIDLTKIKPFVDLALQAARLAGADTPAFTKITAGISTLLGGVPAEQARFDTGLPDAVKARKDAFDRAQDAGGFRPKHPDSLPPPR